MKLTAVEWLAECLKLDERSPNYNKFIIEKAKEMEKQQIMQTRQDIYHTGDLDNEQYYNETFKSE